MRNAVHRTLIAALLITTIDAAAQIEMAAPALTDAPSEERKIPSARQALDQRLEAALDLDEGQHLHLRQLRLALQRQLGDIRAQTEADLLGEEEARWQVKMALAEHRQSRATLLTDEQTKELEIAYNALNKKRRQRRQEIPTQLPLSTEQEEQVRLLLWSQQREWLALQESPIPPTVEQSRALRLTHRVAFEHLLNSRQFALLEQMKNARRRHYGLAEEAPVDTPMLLDDAPDSGE